MSHNPPHRPTPGPDCPRYAPLLPLLDAHELTATETAAIRRHTDGCPWCQQELADYASVDLALHQHLSALMATAPIQSEETIMRMSDRDGSDAVPMTDTIPEIRLNKAQMPARGPRITTPAHTLMAAAAAVLVVALLGVTFAVFSHHSAPPRSLGGAKPPATATALPTAAPEVPYVAGASDVLGAIEMSSPEDGWAVGDAYSINAQQEGTYSCLVLHYSNGQWMQVATPTDAELHQHDADLQGIAMVSPDEGWAVGWGDNSGSRIPSGLILRYSAGKWTKFGITPNAELWSIQMLTPTDGWASGGGGWGTEAGATTSILLHYDGSKWTQVTVPRVAGITSLDMLSSTDGWATGANTILHYDGRRWSIFAELPGISGVSMDSPSDGWAFGFVNYPDNHTSSYNVVWHYDGSQWVRGTLPSTVDYNASILGMSMDSLSDGWAVGYGNGQKFGNRYTLYLHYTHGRWEAVQGPGSDNLNSVFMLSASEGWAVGNGGVLMHYLHGTWTQFHP